MKLSIQATPKAELAYKNMVYVHPSDHAYFTVSLPLAQAKDRVNVEVLGKIWGCIPNEEVKQGTIALSMLQRSFASAMLDQAVDVRLFNIPRDKPFVLAELQIRVGLLGKPKPGAAAANTIIEAEQLASEMKLIFRDQVMSSGLKLAHVYKGTTALQLEVCGMRLSSVAGTSGTEEATAKKPQFSMEPEMGMFVDKVTELKFIKTDGITVKGQLQERSVNKMLEVNFEQLGIGGLDTEFSEIFRRAFASRVYPPDMVENMGLNHVRGLMLFGPPGCGKTLIARQISKALQGASSEDKKREPKVVNGPEILSKFVGEAESNLRALFKEAEEDQAQFGNESELHVIIFDEIDAIAKKRGSTRDGTGVHDSLVNQMLSKIDGVNALNNILLIGMTNRLDMIDSALLRPGRFEIQVEISLPDEHGRVQILNIHTSKMRKAGYLSPDVNIEKLAQKTKNFTGAEIEGLVKGAAAWAFQRQVDTKDLRKVVNPKSLMVTNEDFEQALSECKPQFGSTEAEDEMKRYSGGSLIAFSREFENVQRMLENLARESASEKNATNSLSLVSVLICGEPGSGKTALAAKVAYESGFPLVRILSPDKLIGMSEQAKSSAIADVFDEAYKSDKSLVLLEDIERIIDYSRIGPRFSNQVLQTLLILIRKPPPKKGKRLFIIGTSSVPDLIEPLDLVSVFNMSLHVPQVKTPDEVYMVVKQFLHTSKGPVDDGVMRSIARSCPLPISVKKLLLALEMAQVDGALEQSKFSEFLAIT